LNESYKSAATSPLESDPLKFVCVASSQCSYEPKDAELATYGFPYFLTRARYLCQGVSEADLQDIAQEAWVSFSRKAENGDIDNTEAYIAQVIRNKFMDHLRQEKRRSHLPTISLSAFAEHPFLEFTTLSNAGLINPANELDDQIGKIDFLNDLAAALPKLAPRQRCAIILMLLDKIDDPLSLKQALKSNHINASGMCWPGNQTEKRVLQASLPAARRNLANLLQIDLRQYKQRSRRPHQHNSPNLQ
jgi:RNA polymerase sigma factor (sigma-70 family)